MFLFLFNPDFTLAEWNMIASLAQLAYGSLLFGLSLFYFLSMRSALNSVTHDLLQAQKNSMLRFFIAVMICLISDFLMSLCVATRVFNLIICQWFWEQPLN